MVAPKNGVALKFYQNNAISFFIFFIMLKIHQS